MNQTVRVPIRFYEPQVSTPKETPAPISEALPVAHGVGRSKHIITEAVAFAWHDDLPSWYKDRWILRQRDTAANLIRESTETFLCAKLAFNAYWYPVDEPVEWEAWTAPMWASTQVAR